jgi:hypothetical protein
MWRSCDDRSMRGGSITSWWGWTAAGRHRRRPRRGNHRRGHGAPPRAPRSDLPAHQGRPPYPGQARLVARAPPQRPGRSRRRRHPALCDHVAVLTGQVGQTLGCGSAGLPRSTACVTQPKIFVRRVRLDEERGVLVDVPEDLLPRTHVRGPAEESRVPVASAAEAPRSDAAPASRSDTGTPATMLVIALCTGLLPPRITAACGDRRGEPDSSLPDLLLAGIRRACSAGSSGGPVCVALGGRFSDPARAARPPRRRDAGAALSARSASPARVRDVVCEQLAPHFDHGREFGGGGPVAQRRGRAAAVSGHLPPPGFTQRRYRGAVYTVHLHVHLQEHPGQRLDRWSGSAGESRSRVGGNRCGVVRPL